MSNGAQWERKLLESLRKYGFEGQRTGGSGGGTGRALPDLTVARPHPVFGNQRESPNPIATASESFEIEAKYSSTKTNKYINLRKEEVDQLIEYANGRGSVPVIAARWSSRREWSPGAAWYFANARGIERTQAGNVNLIPEEVGEQWQRMADFFE